VPYRLRDGRAVRVGPTSLRCTFRFTVLTRRRSLAPIQIDTHWGAQIPVRRSTLVLRREGLVTHAVRSQ
jgi:hypothetical protein